MSKSRLEKNPGTKCGYSWPGKSNSLVDCPHVCQLLVIDHGDEHYCCRGDDGQMPA